MVDEAQKISAWSPSLPALEALGRVAESRKLLIGAQGLPLDAALSIPTGQRLRG